MELAQKVNDVKEELSKAENNLKRATLELKSNKTSGLSNLSDEDKWKSDFQSALESIESFSRQVISLQKKQIKGLCDSLDKTKVLLAPQR